MGLVVWRWGVVVWLWGVVAGWGVYRWGEVAVGAVPPSWYSAASWHAAPTHGGAMTCERTWSKQRVFMLEMED